MGSPTASRSPLHQPGNCCAGETPVARQAAMENHGSPTAPECVLVCDYDGPAPGRLMWRSDRSTWVASLIARPPWNDSLRLVAYHARTWVVLVLGTLLFAVRCLQTDGRGWRVDGFGRPWFTGIDMPRPCVRGLEMRMIERVRGSHFGAWVIDSEACQTAPVTMLTSYVSPGLSVSRRDHQVNRTQHSTLLVIRNLTSPANHIGPCWALRRYIGSCRRVGFLAGVRCCVTHSPFSSNPPVRQ